MPDLNQSGLTNCSKLNLIINALGNTGGINWSNQCDLVPGLGEALQGQPKNQPPAVGRWPWCFGSDNEDSHNACSVDRDVCAA